MRISSNLAAENMLHNINTILESLDQQRTQVTTGKRFAKPADDPFAAQQSLGLRSAIQDSESQISSINSSKEWLTATENALSSLTNLVRRAYTLAVRGATDSLTAAERDAMAAQVDSMLSEAIQIGNVQHLGQFIFGGYKTATPAFSLNPGPPTSWTYNGDSGQIDRRVEPGETMAVNIPGNTVFPDILDALIGLRDDLASNDGVAVRARLSALDSALGQVLNTQATAGAKISRLEATSDRLQSMQLALRDLLSKVEDVNMPEAISRLTAQEYAYRVALEINARVLSLSLLDFLK